METNLVEQPGLKSLERVYIAAPFFNPVQKALVLAIEKALERNGIDYFSPREGEASQQLRLGFSPEIPRNIFAENVDQIQKSDTLIVVLDWMLPDKEAIVRCALGEVRRPLFSGEEVETIQELNIPDSGAIWEYGLAFALGKRIYLYSQNPGKLNIMLAQGASGILRSYQDVEDWARIHAPYTGDQL